MRKLALVAGLAAAALIPTLASAQPSCEQKRDNRVVGTVAGAGIGALLGGAIAGHDNRAAGAVIGGLGGAVVGNQVSKPNADCAHAYGYYDRNSQWHANAVDHADAAGYYDRDGAWVDGAPNGYYDQSDRWVSARTETPGGYSDSRGRWIPASADGYYDDAGVWVATASGYYDQSGRWVAGQTAGAYDAQGRWMPGARSGRLENGVWVAKAQPGYYDADRRWRAGAARGYYDARGGWIATSSDGSAYGADRNYDGDGNPVGMRRDLNTREAWLERRIRAAGAAGTLDRRDMRRDLGELTSIRRQGVRMRSGDGRLSPGDEAYLQTRLDRLAASFRLATNP
jgi:hypothetical protein